MGGVWLFSVRIRAYPWLVNLFFSQDKRDAKDKKQSPELIPFVPFIQAQFISFGPRMHTDAHGFIPAEDMA